MSKVTIYRFRGYDITIGQSVVSPRWGTLEAIKALNPMCEPLLNTATEVDTSVVDSDHPGLTIRGYEPSE
jgi:hypothetical protein